MEIEREAMRKTSVQDFQWDGTEPRIDGKHVWFRSIDGSEHGWPQHTEFEAMRLAIFLHGAIAAALTAERANFAAFADEKGESMPVLGKLPVTADGCIAGQGDYSMWNTQGAEYRGVFICAQHPFGIDYDPACEFHEVFSTKQAAEAAKGVNP